MVGEEKRHQMMQNLFGDQSEEEEEEEEVESEHESNRQPGYASDEGDARVEPKAEVEGQGEAEMESEGELHDGDDDQEESDGERGRSSQVDVVGDPKFESEGRESESDEREEYGQRVATSKRRDTIHSGSDRSEHNEYADNEDDEVNQAASPRSPDQEEDVTNHAQLAPEIRDVFGEDSDEEEPAEYEVQNRNEEDLNRSPTDEEDNYDKLRPEDILADEEEHYGSEEERVEIKVKEKPVGPPLELELPFRHPPAPADRMNMIKVSNIMGIDSKPFDPKTYVEEETFVTDDSGSKRRIRLENNIVRWRKVRHPDGKSSIESNARFVRWSDGSLQLLIGNEVLDISTQDAQHDQSHLFLRHGKGILQSQGKILKKMRFMPSSLTSKSHRMLTALVDSRHKKAYKLKSCFTDIDPEREKEQRERAASQTIKATELLNKKKEKVKHKYKVPPTRKERQLSPGFLDDEEEDDYESRRPTSRRQFDDFEMEARAEKRIINAKKGHKDVSRKSSFPVGNSSRRPPDDYYGSEREEEEESEYETEGEEEEEETAPARRRAHEEEEEEPEYEDEEEEAEEGEDVNDEPSEEEEDEEPRQKAKAHGSSLKRKEIESDEDSPKRKMPAHGSSLKRKEIESDEDSPKRKMPAHRRMAIVYDSDED